MSFFHYFCFNSSSDDQFIKKIKSGNSILKKYKKISTTKNPWEYYCEHVNNVENLLLDNIEELFNNWTLDETSRHNYILSLFQKANLSFQFIDYETIYIIFHFHPYRLLEKTDINNIELLKKVIKIRCYASVTTNVSLVVNKYNKLFGTDLILDDFVSTNGYGKFKTPTYCLFNKDYLPVSIPLYLKDSVLTRVLLTKLDILDNDSKIVNIKKIKRERKLVYCDNNHTYDYEQMKSSKKKLHKEFNIAYRFFKRVRTQI